MNWYNKKIKLAVGFKAEELYSFQDRNRLNERIRMFKSIAIKLAFLRKAISQNPPEAQKILQGMRDDKIFTSFPEFSHMLDEAIKIARDNYSKFSEYCDILLEKVYSEVKKLENIRKKFINKVLPERQRERKK